MWKPKKWDMANRWDAYVAYVRHGAYHDLKHTGHLAQQKTASIIFACLLLCVSLACALTQPVSVALPIFGAIGMAILTIVWPPLGLLLLCACAGLPTLVLALPGYHMHLVEPAIGLCFIAIIIRRPPARLTVPHLLALAFLLLAVISFAHVPEIASNAPGNDTYGADKRLLALCFVFGAFFCSTLLAIHIKDGAQFLIGILFVSLPPYLIGLAEFIGMPLAPWLEASGANSLKMTMGRLWGPFPWSVNFGMYLINLFAIAIVCWLLGKRRWQRISGGLMTLITTLSIVGTGTRSVAIAASIITLIACSMTRRFKLLISTILLVALVGAPFSEQIGALFTHDDASAANRLLIWNLALKLIHDNLWLGIGLEQFHYYYAQLIVSQTNELGALGIHPHEQYLEWAMESGLPWLIIGVLFLLSIIVCCTQTYYATRLNSPHQASIHNQYDQYAQNSLKMLQLVAILAIIANMIIGFFDAPLDQLEGSSVLFSLAGLALGYTFPHAKARSMPDFPIDINSADKSNNSVMMRETGENDNIHVKSDDDKSPRAIDVVQSRAKHLVGKKIRFNKIATEEKKDDQSDKQIATRLDSNATGRTIAIQLLSWGIALPLMFPSTALLARYLGPVQYGEYSLTFPFLTAFALLSGTGMDPLIIRQLSSQPRAVWGKILSYALGSRLISTLASVAFATLVACLLPVHTEQRNLFLLGGVSLLFSFSFNGVRIILSHGFRAEQRVGQLAALEAANRLLTAGLIALVVMLHLSLLWIYIIVVYSDLPAFLLQAWLACKRYRIRLYFSLAHLHAHMQSSLPLIGHKLLSLAAGQIDLLVLTIESTPLNVGIYALASRITDPLISIANVYVNGLYPLLCISFREEKRRFATLYTEAVRILLLVALPGAVIVTVEAHSIVQMLGGEQFQAATGAVQILIWAMILTFLNQLAESACTAAHLEHRIPRVTIISTIINIAANLLLIPRWQILGASVATLSSEAVTLCLFTIMLTKYIHPLPMIGTTLSILISNLPALALLRGQYSQSFILTIPLAVILSIASYMVTGTLMREDLIKLWQIGKKKTARHINSESKKNLSI